MQNGTIVFNDYRIPKDQTGGEYQVKVKATGIPASFRKIRIGSITQPLLFVTVDFDKNAYLPGASVSAKVKVRKPDGVQLPVGTTIAIDAIGVS